MPSLHHVQLAMPRGAEAMAARLRAAGAAVRPDAELPGYRRFYADDCFGNRLEFLGP